MKDTATKGFRLSRRQALPLGVVLVLLLIPFLPLGRYAFHVINLIALAAMLAMSLDLFFGYLGQMSLAHASFYGIGAYTAALLTAHGIASFWVATPIAMLVCAAIGAVIGVPTLRLTGFYLAMATLGLAVITNTLMVQSVWLTGGPNGLLGISPPTLFGGGLTGPKAGLAGNYYYLILVAALATYWLLRRLTTGRLGRTITSIRESPLGAAAVGIDVRRVQVAVFALSCALAGLAGSLYAHLILYISPDSFTFAYSLVVLLGVVFGGIGTLWGPILGATLLTILQEAMRGFGSYQMILYALGIFVVIMAMPGGIAGAMQRLWRRPSSQAVVVQRTGAAARVEQAPQPMVHASGGKTSALLTMRGVSKRFGGVQALDSVSMDVRDGEIKGLIGPNGSGKTTLFNCINGFEHMDAGEVVLDGIPMQGRPVHTIVRSGLGRTFQVAQLFGRLSVIDNVLLGGQHRYPANPASSILGLGSARAADAINEERAWELLHEAGLAHLASEPAGTLPYGSQRMLEIARALALSPRMLLLDEPAAGLNTGEARSLAGYLRLIRDRGITLLLVEHNMPFLMGLADSVAVLNLGRKIADGPPALVSASAEVITAYLGAPASTRQEVG